MKNVGGVFIVLCSGVVVAAILAAMEMFWTLWKTTSKEKVRTRIVFSATDRHNVIFIPCETSAVRKANYFENKVLRDE